MSPPLEPAGALMLFGQRFIIDSYVLGNVVWDKLEEKRMLPSSLDALFALGNNAALQLLEPELVKYRYAPQLAALRHLIDGYDAADWQSSIYASWLDGIRALNPPAERESLPRFMQTAAYGQQKMNTQLASWAQLRHDNLLYAKQSYSGMPGCSFPKSLVEPIPDFYVALGRLAERASTALTRLDFRSTMHARGFFTRMGSIADTLETIARKELRHEELSSAEQTFLERMLFMAHKGCVEVPDGWYAELFYDSEGNDLVKEDYVVADVHTAPADENGALVGWVMHVGTGPLNMAVVTCTRPDGETYSYVGPVMSYYERVTGNFQRLTDEAWKEEWKAPQSARPSWVNLYLADRTGGPRDGATHLRFAGVDESGAATPSTIRTSVHPNPTHESVTIEFNVPQAVANEHVTVEIFDNAGARVRTLVAEPLPAGDYAIRWDGRDAGGAQVAAATYHYRVKVASAEASGSISYLPQR
jgi:hypothetical protein